MDDDTPTATVYVNNINEKVRGEKLMQGLKQVFTPIGKVKKIHARKSLKLRGQAFIIYDRVVDAQSAVTKLQGFSFYGKSLRLAFADCPSDLTLKARGEVPERRPAHPKKGMVAVKLEKVGSSGGRAVPKATPVAQPFAPEAAFGSRPPPPPMQPGHVNGAAAEGHMSTAALPPALPHNVLFCEELPSEATEEMLATLFAQYAGFKGVRMVRARACAFVDFGSEPEATTALHGLAGFKLTEENPLKVSYARQ
ncbi:u1 small nuclear ribonucleoprotein a-like [Nannochloropsis oceanica]